MSLSVVKIDACTDDYVVQKFMSEKPWELQLGSQLVVNEGQEAIFLSKAAEPAKAGESLVAPKQAGEQGFYKVWVSDGPIEAE